MDEDDFQRIIDEMRGVVTPLIARSAAQSVEATRAAAERADAGTGADADTLAEIKQCLVLC